MASKSEIKSKKINLLDREGYIVEAYGTYCEKITEKSGRKWCIPVATYVDYDYKGYTLKMFFKHSLSRRRADSVCYRIIKDNTMIHEHEQVPDHKTLYTECCALDAVKALEAYVDSGAKLRPLFQNEHQEIVGTKIIEVKKSDVEHLRDMVTKSKGSSLSYDLGRYLGRYWNSIFNKLEFAANCGLAEIKLTYKELCLLIIVSPDYIKSHSDELIKFIEDKGFIVTEEDDGIVIRWGYND